LFKVITSTISINNSDLERNKKIYFISDVHLGAPALNDNAEREKLFAQWLTEVRNDAAAIFLMGDIFDFWFEYKKVVPRGFTRVLGKLAEITDEGIPVHFFTGNHDIWVFDYLPKETGMIIHRENFETEIAGKKFYLAHGDGLDETDKGYLLLKKIFTSPLLQWLFARIHPNFAFGLAHRWSKNSRLSKKISGPEFNAEEEGMYRFAMRMLEEKPVDYFVFGHRHRMADLTMKNESRFILLGDWIKTFSYGVFDGEKFDLKKYKP
jgi:UDP-2,3-diacylglucosamine hydrolase